MLLQLKDLASQKLIAVPEEGLTFGREGGDAQVQVADMGVSKRHAEIFCEGGAWFLKDLGSSNGTMLANERIADATEILPGDVFQLSKRKFEVLKVVEEDGGGDEAAEEEEQDAPPMTEPERKAPARAAPKAAAAKSAPPPAKKPAAKPAAKAAPEKKASASKSSSNSGGGDEAAEEVGSASVGQVLAGVPKAVAYYLVNVPLLLLNPFGTIRKAIEEQPRDPMGRMELIAWALPGNLFSGAVGTLAGLLAGIIGGAGIGSVIGGLISGLIFGVIGAVIGAIVTGIIWHPFFEWIVRKLFKGESDARSRTNYFLQMQTATILVALPSGLTVIIYALRVRFGIPVIGVIPVLLSAVASALTLFITYKWFESFNVVKWVKIVLLVLMALTGLGALTGIPGGLASVGGGTSIGSSSGDSDVATGDVDDAAKQAIEAMKAAGATADQIAAAEESYKQAAKATKAAAAAAAEAEKAGEAAADAAKEAAKDAKDAAKDAAKAADKKVDEKKPPPAAAAEDKPEPKAEDKPTKAEDPAPPPAAAVPSGGGYSSWRAKYDNIEKRVTDDPTVLRKPNVLKLYEDLQEKTSEADATVRKDYKKSNATTQRHLRDAELFDTAGKTVDELHKALFGR